MTDKELKKLKDDLWHSADVLRSSAHLAANKYGQPILGLIFLRYADILYKQHKDEIEAEFEKAKAEIGDKAKSDEDVLSYIAFPAQAEKFFDYREEMKDKIYTYEFKTVE